MLKQGPVCCSGDGEGTLRCNLYIIIYTIYIRHIKILSRCATTSSVIFAVSESI